MFAEMGETSHLAAIRGRGA